MESLHAEDQPSSLGVSGGQSGDGNVEDTEYVECPVEGCGGVLPIEDVEIHVESHPGESDTESGPSPRSPGTSAAPQRKNHPSGGDKASPAGKPAAASSRQQNAIGIWKKLLSGPHPKPRAAENGKSPQSDSTRHKRLGVRIKKEEKEEKKGLPEFSLPHTPPPPPLFFFAPGLFSLLTWPFDFMLCSSLN